MARTINLAVASDPDCLRPHLLVATDSQGLNGLILDEMQAFLNGYISEYTWEVFLDSDNPGMIAIVKTRNGSEQSLNELDRSVIENWLQRLKRRVERIFAEGP
jgi:hypothetical protein